MRLQGSILRNALRARVRWRSDVREAEHLYVRANPGAESRTDQPEPRLPDRRLGLYDRVSDLRLVSGLPLQNQNETPEEGTEKLLPKILRPLQQCNSGQSALLDQPAGQLHHATIESRRHSIDQNALLGRSQEQQLVQQDELDVQRLAQTEEERPTVQCGGAQQEFETAGERRERRELQHDFLPGRYDQRKDQER